MSDATSNRVQRVADAIRPALNIYPDGTMRVSHGQDDVAETIVRLVFKAMDDDEMRTHGYV